MLQIGLEELSLIGLDDTLNLALDVIDIIHQLVMRLFDYLFVGLAVAELA